jgi:hypothetical protein
MSTERMDGRREDTVTLRLCVLEEYMRRLVDRVSLTVWEQVVVRTEAVYETRGWRMMGPLQDSGSLPDAVGPDLVQLP